MGGKISLRGVSLEEGVDAIANSLRELDRKREQAQDIFHLFCKGDLSEHSAVDKLVARGVNSEEARKLVTSWVAKRSGLE